MNEAEQIGTARETSTPENLARFNSTANVNTRYPFFTESSVMDIHNNNYSRNYFVNSTSITSFKVLRWVRINRWLKYPKWDMSPPKFNHPTEADLVNYYKSVIDSSAVKIPNSTSFEDFLNLGVKRTGVDVYAGRPIYLE